MDPERGTLPSGGSNGGAAAAAIEFGAEPVGGPTLSAVTCPELAMPRAAAAFYVDVNGGNRTTPNGSKAAPFRTIAHALAAIGARRAVVYVAAGMYKENLVVPDKDVAILGGFRSDFASRTNACATVIDPSDESKPIVTADAQVSSFALEGVTVRNGVRGLDVTGDPDASSKASFTIARCVFRKNGTRTEVGGAMYLADVNARVFGSVVEDNQASKGAAIAGGGRVTLTIDQNLFQRNLGYSDHGGGLYLNAKSARIARNTFRGNATGIGMNGSWGGALIVYSETPTEPASANLSYNVFTENLAHQGAAVFVDDGSTVTMSHDLVYKNRGRVQNGVLKASTILIDGTAANEGSTFKAEYLTVVNNLNDENGNPVAAGGAFGGGIYVMEASKAKITGSVFWNNGDHSFFVEDPADELAIDSTLGPTQCSSSGPTGMIPAPQASMCKMGAGVFFPQSVTFSDEAKDDYRMPGSQLGAFAQ